MSAAGPKVLPGVGEIVPFSPHFVSVYHDVVPAGRHDVRLVYLPHSFVVGRAITFVTIATLLITTLVIRVRQSRRT